MEALIAEQEDLIAEQQVNQLLGDTVWKREDSPIIVNVNLGIAEGSTLTIEPGVVVLFDQANMNIFGTMLAVGTAKERILFTSISDNGEGRITRWPGIWVLHAGSVTLSYADFRYASEGQNWLSSSITVGTTGRFEMDHSTIRYSKGNGLFCGWGGGAEAMRVSSSLISGNAGTGIVVSESYVEVTDGTQITGNGGDGISRISVPLSGRQTLVMNSDIVGNGGAGIGLWTTLVPLEQESYGHGNNIYKNSSDSQLAVAPFGFHVGQLHLRHGIARRRPPLPPLLVDWSDNYWGAPLFENGCPWCQAPSYSRHIHLGYEPHLERCERPPKGPISYEECRRANDGCPDHAEYCAVDHANAVPVASTPFDNGWESTDLPDPT